MPWLWNVVNLKIKFPGDGGGSVNNMTMEIKHSETFRVIKGKNFSFDVKAHRYNNFPPPPTSSLSTQ